MKKTIIFTLVILFVAGFSYFVFAKERSSGPAGKPVVDSNAVKKQDANSGAAHKHQNCKYNTDITMTGPMCPLHLMLTQSMMQIQMAAPVNGGIIVLAGNRLLKYDYDLNLVKETEVPINLEETQNKITEMMNNCTACRRTMQGYAMSDPPAIDANSAKRSK